MSVQVSKSILAPLERVKMDMVSPNSVACYLQCRTRLGFPCSASAVKGYYLTQAGPAEALPART